MRKYSFLLLLFICILAAGCCRVPKEKEVLARVGDCEITRQEFEEEFMDSSFAANDTFESRKEFLNNLINRKIILQDAEKKGLHKDKMFLKMIQRFWEQSLLKLALDRKTSQIAGSCQVTDKEIKDFYDKMAKEGKTDKALADMYGQINWELARFKESQAMNDWMADLGRRARVKVNYDLLKKR